MGMTARTTILLLVLSLPHLVVAPAHAEDPGLFEQIGTKLVRGVANLTTGWVELPKQIYVVGTNEGWLTGALRGPFDGMGMFFARTISGAYEILTFPIPVPPGYRPMLRPEYVWEPEPPYPPKDASASADEVLQDTSR